MSEGIAKRLNRQIKSKAHAINVSISLYFFDDSVKLAIFSDIKKLKLMLYLFLNSHKDIVSAFIHKLFCVCLMFCRGLDIFLVYHEYTRNHIKK